jgi:hypothetical protein
VDSVVDELIRDSRQRNRPRHSSGLTDQRRIVSPIEPTAPPISAVLPTSRRVTPRSLVPEPRRSFRSPASEPDPELRRTESVYSEPAYTRLRSELASRRRGGSEEPEERAEVSDIARGGRRESGSELFRALRGTLPGR